MADTGNNQIVSFGRAASGGGSARSAIRPGFSNPRDVGVDGSGNVYVADTGNRRIAKLSPDGGWLGSWKGPAADPI